MKSTDFKGGEIVGRVCCWERSWRGESENEDVGARGEMQKEHPRGGACGGRGS